MNPNESTFCVLPWIHLFVDPAGSAFPCCVHQPDGPSLGNTRNQSIEEIWNSSELKQFRLDLASGVARPDHCSGCYKRDQLEGWSHRQEYNQEFAGLIEKSLAIADPEGSVPIENFAYIDFRISNVCNFKCQTCGPTYSSSWAIEQKKFGRPIKFPAIGPQQRAQIFNFYLQRINSIKKIYFAGGEPLLAPEHYQLLEELRLRGRSDVVLHYNTNLSQLSLGGKSVLDQWQHFDKVFVSPSLDHFGDRAEYIREGTRWPEIVANVNRIRGDLPQIEIAPTITVSVYNVLDLPEILENFIASGIIDPDRPDQFAINFLREPIYLNVKVLTESLKRKTLDKLRTFLDGRAKSLGIPEARFAVILDALQSSQGRRTQLMFQKFTARQDRFHGKDFYALFPELGELRFQSE